MCKCLLELVHPFKTEHCRIGLIQEVVKGNKFASPSSTLKTAGYI